MIFVILTHKTLITMSKFANDYSSCNIKPKEAGTQTDYASAKVLAKATSGGARRAPEYTLESQKTATKK